MILYPYGLFCDERLVQNRTDGSPTFVFSDPNSVVYVKDGKNIYGGGHISFTDNKDIVNFTTPAFHGFAEGKCRVVNSGSCDAEEVCVLKVSDPDQGTVADCNDTSNLPYENTFQNRICCTPTEYCRDGIDNTGDGLVDCASPDCHANPEVGSVPMRCDPDPSYVPGNSQTTEGCVDMDNSEPGNVVFFDHCVGTDVEDVGFVINPWPIGFPSLYDYPVMNQSYYCNYGETDNPADEPVGRCCPQGQWYDQDIGECRDFIPCDDICTYNFMTQFNTGWLSSVYDDSPWCHSYLPTLRGIGKSEACCPIMTHGTYGFYIVDENVKIFGYE